MIFRPESTVDFFDEAKTDGLYIKKKQTTSLLRRNKQQ